MLWSCRCAIKAPLLFRAVAQGFSVQVWGTWGRRFKSAQPDIMQPLIRVNLKAVFLSQVIYYFILYVIFIDSMQFTVTFYMNIITTSPNYVYDRGNV